MNALAPPALDPAEIALFLDFDGTLVPYAGAELLRMRVDPSLPPLLERLIVRTGGATALVSGRGVAELDALIAPVRLPISGTHGAELRPAADAGIEALFTAEGLDDLVALWTPIAGATPGVFLERKAMTLVVHYHGQPNLEDGIVARSRQIADQRTDYTPHFGIGLVEFTPTGADKAHGLARLMALRPFAGRRPVFLGDDVPDEAGFVAVDAAGGVSIRVGAGASAAAYRLADTDAVRDWLSGLAGF